MMKAPEIQFKKLNISVEDRKMRNQRLTNLYLESRRRHKYEG